MGAPLERNAIIRIERGLSRHRAEALPQCSGTGCVIVRFIIEESKLCAGLRLLGRDRFVVRQHRLTPDAAVLGIVLRERAGDRPSRILDWRWNREVAPVVSSRIGSIAGGALAGGGQRG